MISSALITFTSDFGTQDAYIGIVKAVILSINHAARIIDITHHIPPYSILKGALTVKSFYRYYPSDVIHLVVVDPGVGSRRIPLLIVSSHGFFVGPDNGLFEFILRETRIKKIIRLQNKRFWLTPTAPVFHARDIFAPVCAYLSLGVSPEEFGRRLDQPIRLKMPSAKWRANKITGEIISIDHFGNLTTNIEGFLVQTARANKIAILCCGQKIDTIKSTYYQIPAAQIGAVIGSSGFLEIAKRENSAALALQASVGAKVEILLD